METTVLGQAPATTEPAAAPPALAAVQTSFKAYTVLSAIGLAAVIAAATTGHSVNTFMWVRGALLPVTAVVLYRMSIAAAGGSRRAVDRLRGLTVIMPIAIVGVDLVPGVCPLWYAALQFLCMLPVVIAAVTIRRTR